jgi:putative salt-induced outer membrane protein YdiY
MLVVFSMLFGLLLAIGTDRSLAQDSTWTPPITDPKAKDWVQLTSGEWLRGDVKVLVDDSFVFDSKELDELTLDWEDVKALRSPRILTYYFQDIGTFIGTAVMKDSVVSIRMGQDVRDLPRSKLLSIIEGEPTELNYWSGKLSAGFAAMSGNTNQENLNTMVFLRRQTTRTRLNIEYKGNYGKVDGELNVNNHDGTAKFNLLIASGFFVTPASVNLYADKFQNIALRSTIGAGLGYFIMRKKKVEWDVKVTGGYQSTRYVSVEEGQDGRQTGAVFIPSTSFDIDLLGSLELVAEYSATVDLSGGKNNFQHAYLLFTLDAFSDVLEVTFAVTLDRAANPQPAADGTVPDRNDYRTNIGIGIDF